MAKEFAKVVAVDVCNEVPPVEESYHLNLGETAAELELIETVGTPGQNAVLVDVGVAGGAATFNVIDGEGLKVQPLDWIVAV